MSSLTEDSSQANSQMQGTDDERWFEALADGMMPNASPFVQSNVSMRGSGKIGLLKASPDPMSPADAATS